MKLVFGGSAVLATALLTASFVFYVPSSTAVSQTLLKQDNNQEQQEQKKTEQDNNNVNIQTENNKTEKLNNHNSPNDKNNKSAEATASSLTKAESYTATAYALRGRTASGRNVSRGVIAADPRVLPLGSKVKVEAGNWSGEYVVADTGGKIKGKKIDIWVPNNSEARKFGRRTVKLTVLSYGKRPATASSKKVQSTVKTKQKKN